MNDFRYSNMSLRPATISAENNDGSEVELDTARREINVNVVGAGRAWIKVSESNPFFFANEFYTNFIL